QPRLRPRRHHGHRRRHHRHNTFDKPENVEPAEFKAFRPADSGFTVTLPPKSVVALEVK
ncbi:MAG: hypothetical protein HZA91_10230, partial [Verrucomicrobia bacterium]|nr:hypothetical protein [Verrucomicrobiota bacterium]